MQTKDILIERLEKEHPEIFDKYKKDGLIPTKEVKMKVIESPFTQMILYKFGMYATERLAVDRYHLIGAIRILISSLGDDFLIETYRLHGKEWSIIKKKIDKNMSLIQECKIFYDQIKNKKFDGRKLENDIQRIYKKFFIRTASKISLIEQELYDTLWFLVSLCNIKYMKIPNEAFKALEHIGARKIDISKRETEHKEINPSNK